MAGDLYWNSVALAMHMDDIGLTDVKGHTVTLNGTAARSATQFAPLTGNSYSAKFDGTAGGLLSLPFSTDFNLGTGDFSVRAWVFIDADSAQNTADLLRQASICSFGFPSTVNSWAFTIDGSTSTTGTGLIFSAWVSSSQYVLKSSASISKNAWHILEARRVSGVGSLYVDGVSQTLTTNTLTTQNITGTASNLFRIGNVGVTGYEGRINGYIDDFLLTKAARPVEVPTIPFYDHGPQIAGVVKDSSGAFVARQVHLHRQSDGAFAGSALSNAITGAYAINALDATPHYVTCILDSTTYALIKHNLTPI